MTFKSIPTQSILYGSMNHSVAFEKGVSRVPALGDDTHHRSQMHDWLAVCISKRW